MFTTTTDRRRERSDHTRLGTPAHFAAFVRSADKLRESGVIATVRIEGFVVPPDGIWMINGRWVQPGEELTIEPGHVVKYHESGVNFALADDPRHLRAAQRGPHAPSAQVAGSRVYDHREGTMLPVNAGTLDALPRMAASRAARARGRSPSGRLFIP